MSLDSIKCKARSFMRQPRFVQLWFLPVWLLLGLSKLLIRVVAFRRMAPRFGHHVGGHSLLPLLDSSQEHRAYRIGCVVQIASRYTPWDSNCFPQAVTARILLGLYRIPYAFFFGLMRDPGASEIQAHAWVAAGRVRVTGGISFGRFTVVACFVAPDLRGAVSP